MSSLLLPRRSFLTGLAALVAAPAVIRVAPLMPVKPVPLWVPQAWAMSDKTLSELASHAVTERQLVKRFGDLGDATFAIDETAEPVFFYVRLDKLALDRERLSVEAQAILSKDYEVSPWAEPRGPRYS